MDHWSAADHDMVARAIREMNLAIDESMGGIVPDARELGLRGWTLPIHQPPVLIPSIVRMVEPASTDKFFLLHYSGDRAAEFKRLSRNLLGLVDLVRWRPLLVQCVAAFRRHEYLLVVPCLLAVFEGVLATVVERPHDSKPRRLASDELAEADRNLERLAWSSIVAFTDVVFRSATFSGGRPNLLNRHWVLHGRDTPDWSRADALRLFQAIETLCSARLLKRRDLSPFLRDPVLRLMYQREAEGLPPFDDPPSP